MNNEASPLEDKVYNDICGFIINGRQVAYNAVSHASVLTYWNFGRCIVEEEQQKRFFLEQHSK